MVRKKGSLLGSGRQSKVYTFGFSRIMKLGKWLHTYSSLWGSVLPRIFSRGRGYMITERVKTYNESKPRVKNTKNSMVSSFFLDSSNSKSHSAPLFQKWGWQSLLRFPLANLHWRDIRRANLGIRRGKPVILDEWVIKYK